MRSSLTGDWSVCGGCFSGRGRGKRGGVGVLPPGPPAGGAGRGGRGGGVSGGGGFGRPRRGVESPPPPPGNSAIVGGVPAEDAATATLPLAKLATRLGIRLSPGAVTPEDVRAALHQEL